jgi:hypothetical protein
MDVALRDGWNGWIEGMGGAIGASPARPPAGASYKQATDHALTTMVTADGSNTARSTIGLLTNLWRAGDATAGVHRG